MERDDYVFMKIRDAATAINQKVNLIGIVVEFGFPKKTSGTVDESHPKAGIGVNVFAPTMEMLPHVGSAGDIIQLSRVMMKTFNKEIYAVFNKKFSSFALYKGKGGEDFLPYQYSSRFCQREEDKKFISGLRKWLVDFKFDKGSDNFSLLREIKEGARINLACKIIRTSEVNKDKLMLYVWDGTDTPPTNIHKKNYTERLSLQRGRMPYWCFPWHSRLTDVDADADNAPFLTLMDVLTYSEVTAKFKCVARVVASFPWRAEDFRSPSGIYRIRFTLEDPTARIHAYAYGEDGERLFDGYPSVDDLTKKRNKLLGLTVSDNEQESEDAPRNPPWVQFCLKSYYLDKQNVWETRNYRIFGTQIVS